MCDKTKSNSCYTYYDKCVSAYLGSWNVVPVRGGKNYYYFCFCLPGLEVMVCWNSHTSIRQFCKVYSNSKLLNINCQLIRLPFWKLEYIHSRCQWLPYLKCTHSEIIWLLSSYIWSTQSNFIAIWSSEMHSCKLYIHI